MLVPTCPNCGKIFTKDSSVTHHLSQPQTSCYSSIWDIINISQFVEVELPLCHTSPQANPEEWAGGMHNSDNQMHANLHIDFNFINYGFRVAEGSLEEQYEGAGMCYSQDGLTFLGVFDADEYREDNLECLESLFTNSLFHDKLDFVPHHVYTMAAHLMQVYSEWIMGNAVCKMQVCAIFLFF
jgi:hypothetical protein